MHLATPPRCAWVGTLSAGRPARVHYRGGRREIRAPRASSEKPPRTYADFLEPQQPSTLGPDRAADVVARAESLLASAREAVEALRQRTPAQAHAPAPGRDPPPVSAQPRPTVTKAGLPSFDWVAAAAEATEEAVEEAPRLAGPADPTPRSAWGNSSGGSASVDAWFGGKVDTGPVAQRAGPSPAQGRAQGVQVLDRPNTPSSLEFGDSFPASFELHFQEEVLEDGQGLPGPAVAEPTKASGEEFGPDGYWHRWTESSGRNADGTVQWYERWWEVSDWKGMKELGAEKWGCNSNGDAWREMWKEAISVDEVTGQPSVARSAHKWANNARGDEWEEKWDEAYLSKGAASKSASKWARQGTEVWHEEWGEDYDGQGGCDKYTNKWAESEVEEGGKREWGDKWEERFKDGKGTKRGEMWSVEAGGERFNRWWGEDHHGDGSVRKHGNSTAGEEWDTVEYMDTYYNPIPHFGYDLALAHSPQLRGVPTLPWEDDGGLEGTGFDAL